MNTKNTKTPPNTAAIKALKNQGFSVKITHWRKKLWKDKKQPLIPDKSVRATKNYHIVSHFGGATTLFLKKGDEEITVRADCYAKDRFDKRQGIKAALDRLEKLHNIKA